jgi:nucleoside-diphosphate-sugar epimerase
VRTLVIGGTGFIGSHVIRALERLGHDVAVFHRGSNIREFAGDRNDPESLARAVRAFRPDAVLDCILSDGSQARQLMHVLGGRTGRVIALSSQDVYRAAGVLHHNEEGPLEPLPLTEESPVRTNSGVYGREATAMLKSIFGWLTEDYDKIPVERAILGDPELLGTVLRLPMVYGPADPLHRFYPVVKRIQDRRPAILLEERFACWRGTRGFVENVAGAIALAVDSPQAAGRIYNAGDPDTLTEFEWTRAVGDAMGWDGRVICLPEGDMPPHLRAPYNFDQHWITSTQRIRDELGYSEVVSRSEALRRTIEWQSTNSPPPAVLPGFDYTKEDETLARASHV